MLCLSVRIIVILVVSRLGGDVQKFILVDMRRWGNEDNH